MLRRGKWMQGALSPGSPNAVGQRPCPRRPWLAGAVLLAVAGSGCSPGAVSEAPSKDAPPPPVVVAPAREHEVTLEQTVVGTVTPVRVSTVGSPVEGRVVEFLAQEGDLVRAEREPQSPHASEVFPLVRLRTESLKIELAAAEAELKVRQAELEELKTSKPKEIEQAEARKEAAERLKEFTKLRLERTRQLYDQDLASDDELEERASAAVAADKVFEERQAAWELLAEPGYWDEKIKQAEARIKAQEEAINRLGDDLRQHEIYAPFDGYVSAEHTEVGQWVGKGDPIAEIVELEYVDVEVPVLESHVSRLRQPVLLFSVAVDFQGDLERGSFSDAIRREFEDHGVTLSPNVTVVTEKDAARWRVSDETRSLTVVRRQRLEVYRPGTAAEVRIGALPGRSFPGEVAAIVPKADVRSRSFPVKVRVKNSPNPADPGDVLLKAGMFADVTLPVGTRAMLLVPKDALVLGEASETVCVVTPDSKQQESGPGTVQKVRVETDESVDNWIEILGPRDESGSLPLAPGQLVIVEGNERISGDGQRVMIAKTVQPEIDVPKARPTEIVRADSGPGQ